MSSKLFGKKGAFYTPSPKTSRWGLFRPETPAQVTGDSGLAGLMEGRRLRPGRRLREPSGGAPDRHQSGTTQTQNRREKLRPEIPGPQAGDSGRAGDSGPSPGYLRTESREAPQQTQKTARKEGPETPVIGSETPVWPETLDQLRGRAKGKFKVP